MRNKINKNENFFGTSTTLNRSIELLKEADEDTTNFLESFFVQIPKNAIRNSCASFGKSIYYPGNLNGANGIFSIINVPDSFITKITFNPSNYDEGKISLSIYGCTQHTVDTNTKGFKVAEIAYFDTNQKGKNDMIFKRDICYGINGVGRFGHQTTGIFSFDKFYDKNGKEIDECGKEIMNNNRIEEITM